MKVIQPVASHNGLSLAMQTSANGPSYLQLEHGCHYLPQLNRRIIVPEEGARDVHKEVVDDNVDFRLNF